MPEDVELLRAYIESRSESAFAELVRRHLNLVYSAALRRVGGDVHLAEDVSQKVFIALARQAAELARREVLTGWLYTASRFAAVQVVRAEHRRRVREQEVYAMNETSTTRVPDPDWDKLRPSLDDAMDALNERDREALLLRFFEGRAFAELGKKLNLTEEAARKSVDRALDRLRTRLAAKGITSTGAAVAAILANQSVLAAPAGLAASVTGSALAAGGAAVLPTGIFFSLMSTSKIVTGLAVVMFILAAGIATHEVRVRREAEASLSAVNRDLDALMAKRSELSRQAEATEQETATLEKNVSETRAAQIADEKRVAAEALVAKAAAAADPVTAGNAFMARHPEVKQALNEYAKARTNFRYGELFKSLGLTPAQIEQLQVLLSVVGMGAESADGKSLSLRTDFPDNYGRRLSDIIGKERMQEFSELASMTQAREKAVIVAGALYFTDTPLTPEQSDQLVRIMTDSQHRGPNGNRYDWDGIVAKASSLLAPAQLTVLAGMQAQDQFNVALNTPPPLGPATSANVKVQFGK